MKESENTLNFQTPYSGWDKALRFLWMLTWTLLARPLPKSMGRRWKILLLKAFGAKVAWSVNVYSSATVFKPWLLEMDEYACLAGGVDCYNAAPIKIGAYAVVSQRAFLCTAGHDITNVHHPQTEAPIIIAPRAWVAAEAYVNMGVTIGEGAVVGARAAVFKDVEPWTVVGGNPAKFIKKRVLKS